MTPKLPKRQAPPWLDETVYVPKRQRTIDLVKQAIDMLVEQRKQDGTTRISLSTIIATTRQLDPAGKGVAHTAILENEEAYAYYKRNRTANKPKKRQPTPRNVDARRVIKADRDQARVRQRYMKLNREDLVVQLLSVEQQYAELHERYLATNDKLLEWQLRAEQAEAQLKTRQERSRKEQPQVPRLSLPKQRHHPRAEHTTGPLPKHLISLLAFARHHNVAETRVQTHVDLGLLPAKRGEWTDTDGTAVTLALDASGRAAFYQLYQGVPPFLECPRCPHQETKPSIDQIKQR